MNSAAYLLKVPCLDYCSTLTMDAMRSSETLVDFYQTTRRHSSRDCTLRDHELWRITCDILVNGRDPLRVIKFAPRPLLGSSQRANGLAEWRSRGNPNRHARNNRRAVFSVRGPCQTDIRVSVVQLE
jgi:hypothetical protein